jgi:hypothetical protein
MPFSEKIARAAWLGQRAATSVGARVTATGAAAAAIWMMKGGWAVAAGMRSDGQAGALVKSVFARSAAIPSFQWLLDEIEYVDTISVIISNECPISAFP